VADALRSCGLTIHTLASIWGDFRAQSLDDHEWLELAGVRGYVVLMKDNVARVEVNRDVLEAQGLRAFCLTQRGLRGEQQARIFVDQRHRIIQRARKPGPYVYGVVRQRIAFALEARKPGRLGQLTAVETCKKPPSPLS
jgi:hypothetical protein